MAFVDPSSLPEAMWWLPLALALATFVSEDLACIAAGSLVARGTVGFLPAAIACGFGIWAGDVLIVALGRCLGPAVLARAPMRWWIPAAKVERAAAQFAQRSAWLLLGSRFLPGTRVPIYFAAGALRVPLTTTSAWLALASLLWSPLLVGASAAFGASAAHLWADWFGVVPVLALSALGTWLAIRVALSLVTRRGRRLLYGRWLRLARWEYWPRWAVYLPVAVYIVWLAVRHRSLTVVTAANPGIERGGGICGESKAKILAGLARAGNRVATWQLIPSGSLAERRAVFESFRQEHALIWPIVLKPDVGERGRGVVIARNPDQAEAVLAEQPDPIIAQAYVPGVEFGVFYYRRPESRQGEILAITEKRLPSVCGDGRRTLEELILADERGAAMAPIYLSRLAQQLGDVPPAGVTVPLAELGTHCRGALFLDGTHHATPELREAIDATSRSLRGFYFGRYDVRASSLTAFRRGEFTVIELNGLTSEATSIYDPRHSVWHGWAMLCRQWRIAFEIGAANRAAGARPLGLRGVLRLLRPAPAP